MMKRLSLALLAAAGLLAIGSGACTIKTPVQPDFASPFDAAMSGMDDLSVAEDLAETGDGGT